MGVVFQKVWDARWWLFSCFLPVLTPGHCDAGQRAALVGLRPLRGLQVLGAHGGEGNLRGELRLSDQNLALCRDEVGPTMHLLHLPASLSLCGGVHSCCQLGDGFFWCTLLWFFAHLHVNVLTMFEWSSSVQLFKLETSLLHLKDLF